LYVRSYL